MNPRKIRTILLIIAVLVFSASVVIDSYAGGQGIAIKDGEDVVVLSSGNIYVGQGISFQPGWVTLYKPRFPVPKDGRTIGVVTWPVDQVSMIYHQGGINPQTGQ